MTNPNRNSYKRLFEEQPLPVSQVVERPSPSTELVADQYLVSPEMLARAGYTADQIEEFFPTSPSKPLVVKVETTYTIDPRIEEKMASELLLGALGPRQTLPESKDPSILPEKPQKRAKAEIARRALFSLPARYLYSAALVVFALPPAVSAINEAAYQAGKEGKHEQVLEFFEDRIGGDE